jgi:hypothetical protein
MADIHRIRAERLSAAVRELMRGFGSEPQEIQLVTDRHPVDATTWKEILAATAKLGVELPHLTAWLNSDYLNQPQGRRRHV